ncbi:DUF6042 family protein [Streptomyces sp. NPDC056987]|uniref:DUF6042 family protein n=1 Tax=Streptomyces sp. NPDC056987 TaxID=3345988 RepID=UPI003629A79A
MAALPPFRAWGRPLRHVRRYEPRPASSAPTNGLKGIRLALAELVEAGDAQVQRGQEPADAERLEAHQRFRLVMDWDHFHATRMELSAGPTARD